MTGNSTPESGVLGNINASIPVELSWEGSPEEYFRKVIEHPKTVRTAHQRVYDAVEFYGHVNYRRYKEEVIRWNILDDSFDSEHRHAIYGNNVDVAFMNLINVLKAAALGLGQEYRLYLLHGPYGTAKSTFAELLAKCLEAYTKTPDGQLFAPYWVVDKGDEEGMEIIGTISRKFDKTRLDCPLHEEPLAVFPWEVREPLLGELSKRSGHKIVVRENGCPQCRSIFSKFLHRYNNNWREVVEKHLRVRRVVLSKLDRVGIVVVRPKAEKDQDVTDFLGETDFSKLGHYGVATDPRTFDFAGHYFAAHRGFFYWEEELKFAVSFLYDKLGASQEHRVQPKGFMEVDIDEVLMGSTNPPEYAKLKENDMMQAFRDRMIKVDIPYILELRNETRVYDKFFSESKRGGKHLAPHTIATAAFWALLTRVTDPKKTDLDRRGKVKLLNGQVVPGFNDDSIRQLLAESEGDGMQGISPRYINDKVSAAFMSVGTHKNCVNFFLVLRELKEGLKNHQHIKSAEVRKEYEKFIADATEELITVLKDDLYAAIVGDENAIQELHAKYIDHLTAFVNKEKVRDPVTGEDISPEQYEEFMRSIESMIEVSDHETFRQKIVNTMQKRAIARERDPSVESFGHKTDERLYKAYQLYLFEQEKDKINWESLISRKSIDQEGQRRIDTIKKRLVENLGYCEICAAEVMTHVASIFRRGEKAKKG